MRDTPRPVRAIFVGRVVPYKGADMLLEAASQLIKTGAMTIDIVAKDGADLPALREDVAQAWGGSQSIVGPILRLPYRVVTLERDGPKVWEKVRTGSVLLSPHRQEATAVLDAQLGHLGLPGRVRPALLRVHGAAHGSQVVFGGSMMPAIAQQSVMGGR